MSESRRPRVLHVSQPTTEGVARCVLDLVRHQLAENWDVVLACPREGDLPVEAAAVGAEVVPWEATRNPGPAVVRETTRLAGVARRAAPDLVHLHSAKAGLAGRLGLRGKVATVYQPHAWSFLAVEGLQQAAALQWERRALRWTDRVICVSQAECKKGVRARLALTGKRVVVANGIDTERFAPADRDAARARLGLGSGPLAVCVGRLSRQKGQDVLLEAWPAVRDVVPAAELVLVGDGPDCEELAARAPDGVRFVGREDPYDWYTAADLVVLPSRWEGMALVPLEAAACGRSVVVTDVAGSCEAVPPETPSAVVPSGDAAALAAAVVPRLADRRAADAEGERGRRHVLEHHDVRHTAGRVLDIYNEVVRARFRGEGIAERRP
jgi:glycosyltransferase involved in cell wall biosynthesis